MKIITKQSGTIHYAIEDIGGPYKRCIERSLLIPKNGSIRISSTSFKMVYILQGASFYEIMDGATTYIEKGDVLITPTSLIQYYHPESRKEASWLHVFIILFDPAYLPRQTPSSTLPQSTLKTSFTDFICAHFTENLHLKDAQSPHIQHLISSIRDEVHSADIGYNFRIKSLCDDLIISTARATETSSKAPRNDQAHAPEHLIEATKEFIYRHITEELTLGKIAWHLHKSEEHLARIFKKATGFTVFEFIREQRLEHSKKLLHDPRITLTEVAKRAGFSSSAHFSRLFRTHVGIPPSQYRRERTVEVHRTLDPTSARSI